MLDGHRIGVRVKRHRDLRHNKILDFIETLPKDENGEIMKTVLSNHVFNALFLYARLLNGEIAIVDKGATDILTALCMQTTLPAGQQVTNLVSQEAPTVVPHEVTKKVPEVTSTIESMTVADVVESDVNHSEPTTKEEIVKENSNGANIRETRPRFGKVIARG